MWKCGFDLGHAELEMSPPASFLFSSLFYFLAFVEKKNLFFSWNPFLAPSRNVLSRVRGRESGSGVGVGQGGGTAEWPRGGGVGSHPVLSCASLAKTPAQSGSFQSSF